MERAPKGQGWSIQRLVWVSMVLLALYVVSYLSLRAHSIEVWQRDGRAYFIVPSSSPWLYYFYRPLMYLDAAVTGMEFHIGRHRS